MTPADALRGKVYKIRSRRRTVRPLGPWPTDFDPQIRREEIKRACRLTEKRPA